VKTCTHCNIPKPEHSYGRIARGKRRNVCNRCREGKAPLGTPEAPPTTVHYARQLRAKRYIITTAQNATPVHPGLWGALRMAADALGAELVVLPTRYRQPTSADWWAPEVEPYLYNQRTKLNENLVLVGDIRTVPTAVNPLSGFQSLTGSESCILGHSKMQLRTVPVPSGRYPKLLTTTGCCTVPNYTDSKQGAIGEFHHFLGAIVVELDGRTFHLRQLNADRKTGAFTDKQWTYSAAGRHLAPPALALVLGDLHERFHDRQVEEATFGPGGIVHTLSPKNLVWHDTLDGYAVNPHHTGNPFIAVAKHKGGYDDARAELSAAVEYVQRYTPKGRKSYIVASNHDDFLARWLRRVDWREDPKNAEFYLETALAVVRSAKLGLGGATWSDAFAYWVARLCPGGAVRALAKNESLAIGGIECGLHGDLGPNGARGTLANLSRLGVRAISGHSHTPGIEEGHYQVGTSTPLRLEYNAGPSSWLNTHCVIYANGKRSLLTVIDGKWCLPDADP
jgi:hypothetical protein